jgi:hypothetical protein
MEKNYRHKKSEYWKKNCALMQSEKKNAWKSACATLAQAINMY